MMAKANIRPARTPQGTRLHPYNMTPLPCSAEQAHSLDMIALSIFTDCVNAGATFQESLTALYLSGLHQGGELSKDI